MKEIKLKGLDISCFREKLKNGLEVILLPYENKKNYFMSYATRFGSEITTFTPIHSKKEIKVPDGIAHFLEHKMFAQEDGVDPFTYYSESGTGANASTSYDNTQYICYGTKKFEDNLRFLLKYVNSPYYTDENVEAEKGIIEEEIKMYDDIPDLQLEMKLRENIFHRSTRRVDIAGTVEEIRKITKEDLYTCYENFYSPNNMFLLIVGNFEKEKAMEIIHQELDNKVNRGDPKVKNIRENKTVREAYEEFQAIVKVPKLGVGIKVPTSDLSIHDDLLLDLYLNMISTVCFGSSSEFRERVRNEKLLNNFYMEWERTKDFKILYLMASTDDADALLEEIKLELKDLVIPEDAFRRMKKVWIANEVKMIDYIDSTVHNIFDDVLHYGDVIPNKLDIIRGLELEDLNSLIEEIDFSNMAVVKMLPKEEE